MTVPRIRTADPVGSGPLVVLGPSLGTSTLVWERVVPLLASRYRIVAWDLPGHGISPAPTSPFTVGELADGVVAAVTAAGGDEPFRYAGVSLGGATGLELALRHPERVSALAVIASGSALGTPDAWRERAALVRAQSTSALVTVSASRWFAPDSLARDPSLTGRLLHALQETDDEGYAQCCDALAAYDVRDRLGEIATPTLIAWGEFDAVAPEERARDLVEGIPRAHAVRIDGAAHLPPAEQPEATAALLGDFFATSLAEPVEATPPGGMP